MYTFHSDPGHGWLAVNVTELHALGIADKITRFSYLSRDGHVAYLEEDCDLSTFARAKGWTPNGDAPIKDEHHGRDCFIRSLPGYRVR